VDRNRIQHSITCLVRVHPAIVSVWAAQVEALPSVILGHAKRQQRHHQATGGCLILLALVVLRRDQEAAAVATILSQAITLFEHHGSILQLELLAVSSSLFL
jgi:hypothetical protein